MTNINQTAILIFSRTAQAENTRKPLVVHAKQGLRLSTLMVKNVKKIAQQTQLPIFFYAENQQVGSTFAERLTNAFTSIFSKGYQNVIAIGNDCLHLTSRDLIQSATALNQGSSLVLGRATDGGAYLIGYNVHAFDAHAFQNIAWCTPSVFEALLDLARTQNMAVTCFGEKEDVDTAQDLMAIVKKLPTLLKKAITHLLYYPIQKANRHLNILFSVFNPAYALLRAPPLFYQS